MNRRARRVLSGALLALLAVGPSSCRFASPDWDGTQYLCPDGVCPPGYTCVAGECVMPDPLNDGAVADAAGADAPQSPPDAMTGPPDAGVPVTLVFGESSNADVTGVTKDCDLSQNTPTLNYGTSSDITVTELAAYEWRGLLEFDLSAIPATALILSAELHLFSSAGTPFSDSLIYFFEMSEGWQEGIHNGGNGEASWVARLPGTPWTTPGAGAGSHTGSIVAMLTVTGPNEPYEIALPVELVQRWVDGTTANHGLMLNPVTTTTDLVEFESSEATNGDQRPWLAVTFQY